MTCMWAGIFSPHRVWWGLSGRAHKVAYSHMHWFGQAVTKAPRTPIDMD